MFKHVNPKTKEVTYDGYCVELMTRIARELGMSLEWREPKDGVYGALQEDGSWNGMVKELIDDVSRMVVHERGLGRRCWEKF